ncbi:MAG: hypothetical protein RJA59_1785 [Pseudomonadota bacterium]
MRFLLQMPPRRRLTRLERNFPFPVVVLRRSFRPEGRKARLRRCATYCLEPVALLDDGERVFAVLNRGYRPIGKTWGPAGAQSADAYHLARESTLDLSAAHPNGSGSYYLFNDRTAPWCSSAFEREYEARLKRVFCAGRRCQDTDTGGRKRHPSPCTTGLRP